MRIVVLDPNQQPLNEFAIPMGTLLPVSYFVTRTMNGEPVLVAKVDPSREPESFWNMAVLG